MDGFSYGTVGPDGKPIDHSVPGVEHGVVGVITNHSWLDNPTFRGMRQSLMRSFEQITYSTSMGARQRGRRRPTVQRTKTSSTSSKEWRSAFS
jgi:hypothetical protein